MKFGYFSDMATLSVPIMVLIFVVNILIPIDVCALDTDRMSYRSDETFRYNGVTTATQCSYKRADIVVLPRPDGVRPSLSDVIGTLAVVGEEFIVKHGAPSKYEIIVYYNGEKWIETTAIDCMTSNKNHVVHHSFYKINFK